MRSGLLLLTGVLTMVAVFLLVRHFRDAPDSGLDPVMSATEAAETVPVHAGADEDGLEVVIRPVFADVARVQFDRDLMNAHLSKSSPRVYYRVWVINHGDAERRLPESLGGAFVGAGGSWKSQALTTLEGASSPGLPRFMGALVRFESGLGDTVIAAGEMVSILVAAPPSPVLEELATVVFTGAPEVELRSGRVRTVDLLAWEKRPRGRFGAVVSYDETSPRDAEQALRSR